MWIVIILVVIVCVIVSVSGSSQESANQQQALTHAARRPDAFMRLFSEEFPDYSESITFSKAEQAIQNWETSYASSEFKQYLKFFNENEFKSQSDMLLGIRLMARNVAQPISQEFFDYADENLLDFYEIMARVISSSKTLAAQ